MMKIKSIKLNLLSVYFLAYGAFACYFPFLAIYFKSRGLTYIQAGIVFALTSLVSVVVQPIMGYVADKYLSKKKILLINMFACAALIYLFIIANGFYSVALATISLIFFQGSIMSILDAYCYDISDKVPAVDYGQIRLMGSIGFAVLSLILGSLIQYFDINISFYLYSTLFIVSALILSGIDFKSSMQIIRPSFSDVLEVFKNYKFILFVLSVMVLNITLQAHNNYVAILIEATGGTVANLGIVWFIAALSEIPAFYFGAKMLKRYGELNIYIIALILYIIRMLLSAYSTSYVMVIATQFMQSITYPLYLFAAMQYINVIVPDKIRASGITMLSSLGFGLGGLIGNLGGGFILQYQTPFYLYKILATTCFVSLLIALVLKYNIFSYNRLNRQ